MDIPESSKKHEKTDELDSDPKEYPPPTGQIVVILVGLIGSGKSTFAEALEREFPQFKRCNQDDLGGDRRKVERLVIKTLSEGRSVCIDRTNIDARQRKIWIDIARQFSGVSVWIVTMETPYDECYERVKSRKGHPTIKSWAIGKSVLARFSRDYEPPLPTEGFDRMYQLLPHPTGLRTRQEISKVLYDIDTSPSTRLEEKNASSASDLALYVGVPLALGAAAAIGAQQILSRTRGT